MRPTDHIFKEPTTVIFWGSSDDLLEVSAGDYQEEYSVNTDANYAGYFILKANENEVAKVHVIYDGCWCFAYALYEEDYLLPKWNPQTGLNPDEFNAYSAVLSLDIPAHTMIVFRPARSSY